MPILASSMYVNAYGKTGGVVVVESALPLESVTAGEDAFIVKYNTSGRALWSARIGSLSSDFGYGIVADSTGNVYVAGAGGGTNEPIGVYNSDGSMFPQMIQTTSSRDGFIVKYDTSGVVQWVTKIGGSSTTQFIQGISIDSSGNVYVIGFSIGTTIAFNSNGTAFSPSLANAGGNDVFIAKYDANGFVQWIARVASVGDDRGNAIATDSGGNVYVTGQCGDGLTTVAYNSDTTAFAPTIATSGADAFIVKYDTSGFAQWITGIGSSGSDQGLGIASDASGNIYVSGSGGGVVTAFNADATAFSPTLANAGGTDAFIVKYNTSGFVQWAARLSSTAADQGTGVTVDPSSDVYIVTFTGSAVVTVFNADGTAFGTLSNSGGGDICIAKYNTSGVVQWIAKVATSNADAGYAIASDSGGNVYITGYCGSDRVATAFNADGTAFGTTLQSGGGRDAFIAKYNSSGAVQWFTRLASTSNDEGRALTIDSNSNIYATGVFVGSRFSIYGQSTSLFSTLANAGGTDAFVVKYNPSGSPQWIGRVASTDSDTGYGITTDSAGNVYVTGGGSSTLGGTVTAYNSDGTAFATTLGIAGGEDAFIVKYNASGFVQWVARVGATGVDTGFAVSTDSSNNIYIVGYCRGVVTTAFNSDGTAFSPIIPNGGLSDIFAVKYNSNGFVQWLTRVSSTGTDIGYAIASDISGNSYVTGRVGGTITAYNFDGSAFPTTVPDTPLVKYNTTGSVEWIAYIISLGNDYAWALDTDLSGNVYITCQGGSPPQDFYNSDGTLGMTLSAAGAGALDVSIAKYNASGFVQWVARVASGTTDIGFAIATDSSGNVYIGGQNNGTATAFNADGTAFGRTILGGGFIVKYNTNGVVQWVVNTPGIVLGLATDSSGNVYACAQFGTATTNVTFTSSNRETFASVFGSASLVKYDTNGIGQWVQVVRGTGVVATTRSVGVDSFGNSYITGNSASGQTLQVYNTDTTPYKILNGNGLLDTFVVKYSPTTIPQWAAKIASTANDRGFAITTDLSGNVYVTGEGGSAEVIVYNADGTAFSPTLTNGGGGDAFIVKYNTSGVVQWVARVSSSNSDIGYAITTDSSGNVYVTGQGAQATVTAFNSDTTAFATTLPNAGTGDAFIVKYDTSGFVQWVARVASTAQDIGRAIATDSSGNVYVSGSGGGVVTAFNADATAFSPTLANAGGTDAFIVKYNTSGFVQWVARVSANGADIGYAIAATPAGDVYMTGQAGTAVTAKSSDGTVFATTIGNAGAGDAFVVKYNTGGFVQWVARVASTGADVGTGIAVDTGDSVYVLGYGPATITAFSSNGIAFSPTLANLGGNDIFLVKYNASGIVQWNVRIASTGSDI